MHSSSLLRIIRLAQPSSIASSIAYIANSLQVCIHLRNQGDRNACSSSGLSSRVANDLVVGYLPNSVLVFGALILWQTGEHSARGILVQPRIPVNNDLCHLVEVLDMPSNLAIQVAVQSNQVVEYTRQYKCLGNSVTRRFGYNLCP